MPTTSKTTSARKQGEAPAAPAAPARKRVSFQVHAPEAQAVAVAGDFNDWNPAAQPMKRDPESGTWKATLTLPAGQYQYRYVIDGQWVDDPQCDLRAPNPFGGVNSVRIVG